MNEQLAALRSALADQLGSSLRVLGYHEGEDWTVEYIRDDLRNAYDTDALDDIAGDLSLAVVGGNHQEDLYDLGAARATVRVFDDGVVAHVPTGDSGGYVVSADPCEDLVGRGVVATIREHAAGTKR